MPSLSARNSLALASILLLAAVVPAQAADDDSASTAHVSKIRIVRLSEVKGVVQLDRDNGRGFEPAMANMPIVENSKLRTDQGVAEVEFEDNSSLRLAPNSEVAFSQLERAASGATRSSIQVLKGTVYASTVKSKSGNDFNLVFGEQKLALPPATHIRLDMQDNDAKVAVLDGSLRVEDGSGTQDVGKKKTVTFPLQEQTAPEVAKDVTEAPFDTWDKQSADYHARSANFNSTASSPYAYGSNDMAYYGSFVDAGACGSMWRPYFASAAWDPYSNGSWAWYGGAGYSWVSPYPWGWMPYHSGSWGFCPGTGWGWTPGGAGWTGLNNTASILSRPGTPAGSGPRPAPIHPPTAGSATVVAVNTRPLVHSGIASPESFLLRQDSAGMGIPRETLGRLDKLSHQADQKGFAHTPIYITGPTSAGGSGMRSSSAMAPPVLHRGSPPSDGGAFSAAENGTGGRPSAPSGSGVSRSSISSPGSAPSAPSGGPAPSTGGRPR